MAFRRRQSDAAWDRRQAVARRAPYALRFDRPTVLVQRRHADLVITSYSIHYTKLYETAGAGDICAVAGFETIDVGDSLCDPANPMPLDPMHIEEPTLSVTFAVNDSPLAGTEGKFVTSNKIQERLEAEMNTNIAMNYAQIGEGKFKVNGRGELQIRNNFV